MKLAEHERIARRVLQKARVDSPELCARVLVAQAAGLTREQYIIAAEDKLSEDRVALLEELVGRRAMGEPLAYILGEKEFYACSFVVNSSTLVPRPETEGLVDMALDLLPQESIVLADLGCGCGCIGLSLLHARPHWHGILMDNSPLALDVSRANGQRLRLQAHYLLGDMFHPPLHAEALDLVVCNPPYIGERERSLVMRETLAYEPCNALFSGNDGTSHLVAAVIAARHCLKLSGLALFEHGIGQEEFMDKVLAENRFTGISERRDMAGIQRYTIAYKGE